MARICDICGREISTYNSRYTLTYKSVLYSKEKDICPLCFEKFQEQFKKNKVDEETEMERLERINNDIEDAWAKIRELTDEPLITDILKTCSFSDCDNFKNPDYARCIECKRKQIEAQTERSE